MLILKVAREWGWEAKTQASDCRVSEPKTAVAQILAGSKSESVSTDSHVKIANFSYINNTFTDW